MSNFKYVDVLLAEGIDGELRTFVLPISTAHVGDTLLHDGELYTVTSSSWFDPNDEKYAILEGAATIYTPDKVLRTIWEKE